MKIAALDLGTNSFLCLIAEVVDGKIRKVYQDQVQVVRLGQEINSTKKFHPDALLRAEKCLNKFAEIIYQEKPDKVMAVSTAAARIATNRDEFYSITNKLNIPVQIIPGELEAEITFQGAISGVCAFENEKENSDYYIVIDVGGASTEIILGDRNKILVSESCNIGCVSFTENFFNSSIPIQNEINNSILEIKKQSSDIVSKIKSIIESDGSSTCKVIAVAGTPTTLAALECGGYDALKVEGFKLSLEGLEKWHKKFSSKTCDEIAKIYKLEKGRSDVINMGTIILKTILKDLNINDLSVSIRGVRFGLALAIEKGII